LQKYLYSDYKLKTAFRENMPTAGIIYDVTKSDEELLNDMNSSCRKRIKKSIAGGLKYAILDTNQYEKFFKKWQLTADIK
jgi:lipid II:glycine glycyltransferase (peptidoglycan interpeptide bridge formation enzyme)